MVSISSEPELVTQILTRSEVVEGAFESPKFRSTLAEGNEVAVVKALLYTSWVRARSPLPLSARPQSR